jgi:hypothetical protein
VLGRYSICSRKGYGFCERLVRQLLVRVNETRIQYRVNGACIHWIDRGLTSVKEKINEGRNDIRSLTDVPSLTRRIENPWLWYRDR